MKVQDIIFIIFFVLLFLKKDYRLFVLAGIICWLLAIPLFAKWVFFTAERLTWYGTGFVLTGSFLLLLKRNFK